MNTLTHLFDWLLAAGFRASLLTLVVLLIQAALRHHLSARMRYALWMPVLIVLLMPLLPQSRWSIEHVFQTPPRPVQITPAVAAPAIVEPTPVVFEAPASMPKSIDSQSILMISWAIGSAGILIFGSISFMLTLRRFKQARHPASNELLATLAQISREVRLRHVPRLLIASSVSSPAVTGLLCPTLLLPAQFDREFTPAEARLVLKHELMHLKRGDLPLNALMCVLMALHWFNPLLWIAFFKIRADREAACDAQVLQDAPNDRRIAYGHALLKVETAFCPRGLSLGFVGIFQRGAALRSRIQSIAIHRAPHPVMKAMTMLCIALMTFFGITRAQQPAAKITSDFAIGKSAFRPGDSIVITSLKRSADMISVGLDYELASTDEATAALYISSSTDQAFTFDKRQHAIVKKGRGSLVLHHPLPYQGQPHVTFYDIQTQKPIGGIYFGTETEAAESRAFNLDYMTASAPADSGTGTVHIRTKLEKIILPQVQFQGATVEESLEYLRVKSRALDTLTTDPKQRGVSILYRPGETPSTAVISLDLKDVPLGEALRYVVDLANLKMSIRPYAVLVGENITAAGTDPKPAVEIPSPKIIFPSVEFRDAPLAECLDYIRIKARELDPDKKGVNIILKPGGDATARVTLSLKDVPVYEALRYCAELANHKLTTDTRSYYLTPGSEESPANKDQASSAAKQPPSNAAEAKAVELRKARPQQYDFNKAELGDVLRFLATDAQVNFISLSEDNPISQKLVTFSIKGSPFEVLETLCRANGAELLLDQNRWYIRAADDPVQIGRSYPLPKSRATVETIFTDITTLLGGDEGKQADNTLKPSVTFKKDEPSFHVMATRLQHSWVGAYFQGLNSAAQTQNTK